MENGVWWFIKSHFSKGDNSVRISTEAGDNVCGVHKQSLPIRRKWWLSVVVNLHLMVGASPARRAFAYGFKWKINCHFLIIKISLFHVLQASFKGGGGVSSSYVYLLIKHGLPTHPI